MADCDWVQMGALVTAELQCLSDPLKFGKALWPHVEFYGKQREVIYSVRDNDATFVPAGNMLGV